MNENPIQALMTTTMQSIKQMIDVNTVVGEAVTTDDGTIIIPVTKVSFGFAASGLEMQKNQQADKQDNKQAQQAETKYPFCGGSGCGAKIEPIAFLVITEGGVRLVPIKSGQSPVERILEMVPELIDKANDIIKDYTKKHGRAKSTAKDSDEEE